MKKDEVTRYLLESLGDSRRKTVKMDNELLKYFSHNGSVGMVARELEKRSGHPCSLELDYDKRRIHIKNTDKLITKSTLRKRLSDKLIEIFFSEPTIETRNPYYSCAPYMCLYAMSEVKRIERTARFRSEYKKLKRMKDYRRNTAMMLAEKLHLNVIKKKQ
jgi:hypothetical protein